MKKDHRTTDGFDERAIDAMLATLTDPGDDPAFRATVLARLEGTAPPVAHARGTRHALVAASLAATVVAVAFLAWRTTAPSPQHDAGVVVDELPSAPSTLPVSPIAPAAAGRDEAAGEAASLGIGTGSARAARAGVATVTSLAASAADVADEEPLPYGMERIRVARVSITPLTVGEVRDEPSMVPLATPAPVRIDPIEIDPIAPRR